LVAGQAKHGGLLRRCSEEAFRSADWRGAGHFRIGKELAIRLIEQVARLLLLLLRLLHAEGAETSLLGRWLWLGKEASGRHCLALRALRTE